MGTAHLTTARLSLRPLAGGDEASVLAALSDAAVSRWLTHVPYPYTPTDFADFRSRPISAPGALWVVEEAGRFLGVVGLNEGELGYWFARRAWGLGIATEAARAVVADAFAGGAERLTSGHADANPASGRVLAKLGFEDEGAEILGQGPGAVRQFPGRRVALTRARWERPS